MEYIFQIIEIYEWWDALYRQLANDVENKIKVAPEVQNKFQQKTLPKFNAKIETVTLIEEIVCISVSSGYNTLSTCLEDWWSKETGRKGRGGGEKEGRKKRREDI